MNRPTYIVAHAVAASAFIFVVQRFALGQSLETALLWAAALGLGAAALAWKQTSR